MADNGVNTENKESTSSNTQKNMSAYLVAVLKEAELNASTDSLSSYFRLTLSDKPINSNLDNAALYAPALSETYVNFAEDGEFEKIKIPFNASDLRLLDSSTKLFHYPIALYSAGQAAKDEKRAAKDNWVSKHKRQKNTVVVADSGGFQIQNDKIKFEGDKTCERMLRWMEKTAEHSMILDFPTGGIAAGNLIQHVSRLENEGVDLQKEAQKNGVSKEFMACLVQTERNNQYFEDHHQNKTEFLNVIQGRNERESKLWYERMRKFSFKGFAFANRHSIKFSMTTRRIVEMLNNGDLKDCSWIHFLGVSTFRTAAILNFLQEEIRLHPNGNKDLQITFDSASGSLAVAFGYNAYIGFDLDPKTWRFKQEKINIAEYKNSDLTLNQISEKMANEKYGSNTNYIACKSIIGDHIKPSDVLKISKDKEDNERFNMTDEAGFCLMNHNMEVLTKSFVTFGNYLGADLIEMPVAISKIKYLLRSIINPSNEIDFEQIDPDDDEDTKKAKHEKNSIISQLRADPFDLIDASEELLDAIAMKVDT